MGRSITPRYAVEFFDVCERSTGRPVHWTPMGWNSAQAGRPSTATLQAFVEGYEASTRADGVNAHLGETRIGAARIVRNDGSKQIMAEYAK